MSPTAHAIYIKQQITTLSLSLFLTSTGGRAKLCPSNNGVFLKRGVFGAEDAFFSDVHTPDGKKAETIMMHTHAEIKSLSPRHSFML